jgi:hypothetical protein
MEEMRLEFGIQNYRRKTADRFFSGDHDYAASPNIPSARLRCVC